MGSVYHNYGNAEDINKILPNSLNSGLFALVGPFTAGQSSLVFAGNAGSFWEGYTIELETFGSTGGFTAIVTAQAINTVILRHGDTLTGQIIDRIDDIGFDGLLGMPVNHPGLGDLYSFLMGPLGSRYITDDTGETFDAYLVGNASANRLVGGLGKNFFEGGPGADLMNGGVDSDTYRLYKNDFADNEFIGSIGGGADAAGVHDTIEVKLGTHPGEAPVVDLSIGGFGGIEVLRYIPTFISNAWIGNDVTISGEEAFAGTNNQALAIWGSVSTDDHTTAVAIDTLRINNNGGQANTDFSTMAFTAWQDGIDTVIINSPRSVTGTIKSDIIDLTTAPANGPGVSAKGSDGDDVFIVGSTLPTLDLEGGNGSDTLKTRSANVDLTGNHIQLPLTVERLVYDTGNSTVTTTGWDIAAGAFHNVTGSAGTDTLVINVYSKHSADLSGMVFTAWTDGTDVVQINGEFSAVDTLTGSSQADTIRGFTGNDILNGGGGIDTAVFSGQRSAYTITRNGATLTVVGPDGTDTLTSIEKLKFDNGTFLAAPPVADFNPDGHSDILWRNDNGAASIWDSGQIGGAHVISGAGVVPTSWHISGKADFDGNGQSDILWRNDNGTVSIWDNGAIGGAHVISAAGVVANSWHISGTGDFDGNGKSDILWSNDNGTVSIWNDGAIGGAHVISNAGVVANSWHISGTGDFDGNGKSDILWRNDNGTVSIWDDGAIGGAHVISAAGVVANAWHISGVGDFDANGKSDILWRHDNGTVSIWNDGAIGGAHIISAAGVVASAWHISDTGDYDGNGKTDILWRHDNGTASIWDDGAIGGAHVIAGAGVVPNDWHIA